MQLWVVPLRQVDFGGMRLVAPSGNVLIEKCLVPSLSLTCGAGEADLGLLPAENSPLDKIAGQRHLVAVMGQRHRAFGSNARS